MRRPSSNFSSQPVSRAVAYDMGLRAYMIRVFQLMGFGLGLTGLVSYFASSSPALMQAIFGSPLQWVVLFAPLGLAFYLQFRLNHISASAAQMVFWLYAGLLGLALAPIFLVYTGTSIARVFFITGGTFGAVSLYGYTTQKDLTSWGTFLFMGLIGIIIASIVNLFMRSSMMEFVISFVGVAIFTGLTAYDTQRIKEIYSGEDSAEIASKKAIFGALALYLDFINLFLSLLRLLGDRRS